MKTKLKKILIPFIIVMILDFGYHYLAMLGYVSRGYSVHSGMLVISGILFGPYGALGAVTSNFLCNMIKGQPLSLSIALLISNFFISYLAYKLWYGNMFNRFKANVPRLDNTSNLFLFLLIIFICSFLYSETHINIFILLNLYSDLTPFGLAGGFFFNVLNFSFIFGIIGLSLAKHCNFIHIPKKSEKYFDPKVAILLDYLLVIFTGCLFVYEAFVFIEDNFQLILELVSVAVVVCVYIIKPITSDVSKPHDNNIPENIMNNFVIMILIIMFIAGFVSSNTLFVYEHRFNPEELVINFLFITDVLLMIFLVPATLILKYIENKVIKPITSFSQIETFIHKDQRIESDKILEIYSEYVENDDEIGQLARSYSDLINNNNQYIDNIDKIEGEKKRIEAELDVATNIQQSKLPTAAIKNKYFTVNGYSRPAREVGGDFFDYYYVDEDNLAIVIGDASGKGIPAALLSTTTQALINQLFYDVIDPSKILYLLNNKLCKNNPEMMFITLWVGVYNKNTKKLVFSNGGHNPPLIKDNGEFKYLKMNKGIALGVVDDYEFKKEEILLNEEIIIYSDGITDACNFDNEMYGEESLINFFNNFNSNSDPIVSLLDDINDFVDGNEQYDDMTLLYLRINDD